jgi:hypothetical protein
MKIVGCDLHAKQQSIAMVDTETGEFTEKTLARREQGTRVLRFLRRSGGGVSKRQEPCSGFCNCWKS